MKKEEKEIDLNLIIKFLLFKIKKLNNRRGIKRNIKYLIYWKDSGKKHNA